MHNSQYEIDINKFYAQWCGPCKQYSKVVDKVKEVLPEVKVSEVDIEDDELDLVTKYGVRSVPTTVILKDGEVTFKKSGIVDYQSLINELK